MIFSLSTQAQKQQEQVPQQSVQPEDGCELIPGDAQLGELYIVIMMCVLYCCKLAIHLAL